MPATTLAETSQPLAALIHGIYIHFTTVESIQLRVSSKSAYSESLVSVAALPWFHGGSNAVLLSMESTKSPAVLEMELAASFAVEHTSQRQRVQHSLKKRKNKRPCNRTACSKAT